MFNLVGTTGFEPATSWSQTTRSEPTELRPGGRTMPHAYAPVETMSINKHRLWAVRRRRITRRRHLRTMRRHEARRPLPRGRAKEQRRAQALFASPEVGVARRRQSLPIAGNAGVRADRRLAKQESSVIPCEPCAYRAIRAARMRASAPFGERALRVMRDRRRLDRCLAQTRAAPRYPLSVRI